MSDTTWGASEPAPGESSDGGSRGETAPSRPSMPVPPRSSAPRPIEGDVGELVEAVTPPENDEIMPTTGGIPFVPVEGRPISPYDTSAPSAPSSDDVHLLGETAISNASMSASGAPTPMAGVPLPHVRADGSASSAQSPLSAFGDGEAPFVPRYEPRYEPRHEPRTVFTPVNATEPEPGPAEVQAVEVQAVEGGADQDHDIATHEVAGAGVPMSVAIAAMVDDESREDGAETPSDDEDAEASDDTAETARVTAQSQSDGGDAGDDETPDTDEQEGPRARKGVVAGLVALGALVWAGAAYGAVQVLSPEAVVVPAETHVTGEPGPSISPTALVDPSDFLGAMPLAVGTMALTAAEEIDPISAGVPERAAEVYDLQYSDGTTVVQVRAIQHYSEAAAIAAYDSLTEGATDVEPVTNAEGTELGERAVISNDGEVADSSVVWRNGTAVFIATGDEDAVERLYRLFGL